MMYWPGVSAPQPQSQPSAIGSVLTGVSEASRSTGEAYLRLAQARTASFRASIQPVKNSRHRRHRSTSSSYTRSFLKKRRKLRRQISRQVSQPDPSQQDANAVYANDVIEGRSQQAMDDRESNMNDGDEGMCSQQVMDNGESCLRATLSNLSVAEEELCSPAMGDVAASDPREAEELGPQAQTMNSAEIGQRRRAYSVVDEKPINHDEVCFAPSHTRIRKKMISTDLTREHVDQEWARSIKLSSHSVFTSFDEDVSVDPRIDEFLEFAASRGCSCEAWSEMTVRDELNTNDAELLPGLSWPHCDICGKRVPARLLRACHGCGKRTCCSCRSAGRDGIPFCANCRPLPPPGPPPDLPPISPSADHLRCRSSSACPFRRGSESEQSADWVCLHDQ